MEIKALPLIYMLLLQIFPNVIHFIRKKDPGQVNFKFVTNTEKLKSSLWKMPLYFETSWRITGL